MDRQGLPSFVPQINFAELPQGIIHFTATPHVNVAQIHSGGKAQPSRKYQRRPRRVVTKKEVEDISGLMTKLNFQQETGVSASHSPSLSGAQREGNDSFSTNQSRLTRRRAIARRKGFAKISPGARGGLTAFKKVRESIFRVDSLETNLVVATSTFRPWLGCRRKPFKSNAVTDEGPCISQHLSFMTDYYNQSVEEIRVQDYTSGLKGQTSRAHCGPKFQPVEGTDMVTRRGITHHHERRHQCISAMEEYKKESFEELRLEHYMPAVGWEDRERCHVTVREMQDLPITIHSEVYVFIGSFKRKGKVVFVGRLPDKPKSAIFVGVELDGPYGDGHGYYGGVKLFRTNEHHAEIVPLDAALPAYLVAEDEKASSSLDNEKETPKDGEDNASASISDSGNKEGNKCAVCWTNTVEMFFRPCGHVCCCASCSRQMTNCPICRKKIEAKHKAYLS